MGSRRSTRRQYTTTIEANVFDYLTDEVAEDGDLGDD